MVMASCTRVPSYVIGPDKMSKVIADLHVAEAVVETNRAEWDSDSSRMALKQLVCERNGVTLAELDTSLVWYGRHLDKYSVVYENASKLIDKRIARLEENAPAIQQAVTVKESSNSDSTNVYNGIKFIRISTSMPSETVRFVFKSDRNWERGDKYVLSSKSLGIHGVIEANLAVTYSDGTTEYVSRQFGGTGKHAITLVLDSAKNASVVYGDLNCPPAREQIGYVDSISVIRTRNHDDNQRERLNFPSTLLKD